MLLGQYEIRQAIALKKRMVLIRESCHDAMCTPARCSADERTTWCVCVLPDESDARHGAYDFYAEQQKAPEGIICLLCLWQTIRTHACSRS